MRQIIASANAEVLRIKMDCRSKIIGNLYEKYTIFVTSLCETRAKS